MAVIAFSSSRPDSPESPHPFERLVVTLSSTFSSIDPETLNDTLDRTLEEIGTAFGMDECAMLSFEGPNARVVASWAVPPAIRWTDEDVPATPWLAQRLSRNAVVAMNATTEFPQMAAPDRAHAERMGVGARLAVPIAIDGRVAFGLVIGTRQRHVAWEVPVIDRLRLLGEIVGGGVARYQQAESVRTRRTTQERAVAMSATDGLYLEEEERTRREHDEIIGESVTLRVAMNRLAQVAALDATVLLLGETGTGKELFARALHQRSRRRDRTLVRVNCAALPPSLIESELFGHERGAFTGAVTTRQGRFELADGGTIFLDEIGDLAPELQAKLLRVLQEGEFERVGSSKTRQVDVRVIAGTHVDLEKAMTEGRFRADLYYRLSVFPISLPALRERPGDIEQLVWFFIHRRQRDFGRRITRIPADVIGPAAPRLARQRPRTGERHRAGPHLQHRRDPAARRSAAVRRESHAGRVRRQPGRYPAGAHRTRAARLRRPHQRRRQRRRAPWPASEHAALPDQEARRRQSPTASAGAGDALNMSDAKCL